ESARDVGRAAHDRHRDGIDRVFHAAEWGALGLHSLAAGRRNLPGGEAVDLVVHDDVGEIDVAAHDVDEVIAADPEPVAVSAGDEDLKVVVPKLRSGRNRQRAAMQGVHAVSVDVAGQVGGAADSADGQDFVRQESQLGDGRLQRVQDAEVSTARAPVGVGLS